MPGESLVQVNSGTGPKLHTFQRAIGANNVEDEIVILGNQYLAEYIVGTGTSYVSWATADSHVLQLMAGASLNVYVTRIRIYQHAVATTAALTTWELFRLTSAGTGGTAFTPAPVDTTDPASGATCMTLPTVKGATSTVLEQAESYVLQTIIASLGGDMQVPLMFDWDFRGPRQKAIRIPAGAANGIAVQNRQAIAGANGTCVISFYEAPF